MPLQISNNTPIRLVRVLYRWSYQRLHRTAVVYSSLVPPRLRRAWYLRRQVRNVLDDALGLPPGQIMCTAASDNETIEWLKPRKSWHQFRFVNQSHETSRSSYWDWL